MKIILLLIILGALIPVTPAFAQCIVNDDWPDAPCLDEIINGWYIQEDVNRWAEYYSYKGDSFMEEKHLELKQAINQVRMQEWIDESDQNANVYYYYFFSGRAPSNEELHGQFNVIQTNEPPVILNDESVCGVGFVLTNGICMNPDNYRKDMQTGEAIFNPQVLLIIERLGAGLIVSFIIVIAIKKRRA